MKLKLFYLLGILAVTSCTGGNKSKGEEKAALAESFKETVIPVSIANATIFNFLDHAADVRYVALEATDESLISKIDKVYLHGDYIIVYDVRLSRILLFGKDGTFERQIGRMGQGADEYTRLNDVFFDQSSELIYAHERLRNTMFVYNLQGEIVKQIKPNFSFNSFCKTPHGFWLYTCFANNNPNGYNLMLVDDEMQEMIGGYFPQHPNFINVEFVSRFCLDAQAVPYFTYPTSNCIYRLKNAEPESVYKVDFGSRTAPYEEIAQISTSDEYDQLLSRGFFKLGNCYIWDNLLCFSFSESALGEYRPRYYGFYNIADSELTVAQGCVTTKELPTSMVLCTSGGDLIFSIFPHDLQQDHFEFMEQQVARELDDDSNPVLIICSQKR